MLKAYTINPGEDLTEPFDVRLKVFVQEQGFSQEIEIDDTDPLAYHVVITDNGRPIATARTFESDEKGVFIIGRVAVRKEYRGSGVGIMLMQEAEKLAAAHGAKSISLGAQKQAQNFYAKCGYSPYGENYYEEFCEHVHMKKEL